VKEPEQFVIVCDLVFRDSCRASSTGYSLF